MSYCRCNYRYHYRYRYRYNQSFGSFACTYTTSVATLRYIQQINLTRKIRALIAYRPHVSLLHKHATLKNIYHRYSATLFKYKCAIEISKNA